MQLGIYFPYKIFDQSSFCLASCKEIQHRPVTILKRFLDEAGLADATTTRQYGHA